MSACAARPLAPHLVEGHQVVAALEHLGLGLALPDQHEGALGLGANLVASGAW
jgi:hypothetical protein